MGVPLKGAVGSEGCQYFSSIQMVCDVLQKCIARRLGTCSETGVLPGLGAGTLMKRGASGGRVLVRKDPRRCWLRVDVRAHLPPVLWLGHYGHSRAHWPWTHSWLCSTGAVRRVGGRSWWAGGRIGRKWLIQPKARICIIQTGSTLIRIHNLHNAGSYWV